MIQLSRRIGALALAAVTGLAGFATPALAQVGDFPSHTIELVVPFQPGGGTDALARAFADASRKHTSQSIVVVNKPGASGAIGWGDVVNSKPDGYKLALLTVELTTLPHLGLAKFTHDDFALVARLNADQAAITVKADSPYNTIEEFLAAAKKSPGDVRVGNAGNGSIWHLAATALEDKTGTQFNHVPFQGAGPAVQALLGGHIDAVAVSPAEVSVYVGAGKLKMLAVMADQRVKGFDKVPTLKERQIDLTIGTWRGIGAPKNTPPEVLAYLRSVAAKTAAEPALREAMDKLNLGYAYADDAAFRATMTKDNVYFKTLITKLNIKN